MNDETVGSEVVENSEVENIGTVADPVLVTVKQAVRKTWGALEYALVVNSCESAKEVSEKTGLSIAVIHSKSSGLRKKGVKIKNFQRGGGKGRAKLDYAAINAALDSAASPE